jgi:hypothetical protein
MLLSRSAKTLKLMAKVTASRQSINFFIGISLFDWKSLARFVLLSFERS